MRKIVCSLFCSPSVVCDLCITKIVIFSMLWLCAYPSYLEVIVFEFWLCAYPSCVKVIVFERGELYPKCRVIILQWRSLCGRSYVDIVKILLCEGENVKQWLEPRNITYYLHLIRYLLTLSLLYFVLLYIAHIHMLDIVCICPHLC